MKTNDTSDMISIYQNLIWSIVKKTLKGLGDNNYKQELEIELFQEGFLGLLEAKKNFDETKSVKFTTFAYTYIKGYCLNYIKKEINNNKTINISEIEDLGYYEEEFIPTKINILEKLIDYLKKTNKHLTNQEQRILQLRIDDNLSYEQIGNKLNCSKKQVYNTIYKYKEIIKKIIINEF